MRFSIIMPVYNTGEILRTAIDSILSQSFQDFELLLIDDGSTDGSPKICDEYAAVDKRVRCFHKQNGGICDARNYGMERSRGEYIGFCDHDDEYLPTYLETVDRAISEYGADMVKVGYKNVQGDDKSNATDMTKCEDTEVHDKASLSCNLLRLISISATCDVWDCFWRKDVITDNNITFDTSYRHGGEDIDFNHHILPFIKSLVLLPQCLYVHYVRLDLSTSAKVHEDVLHSFYKRVVQINKLISIFGPSSLSKEQDYYALCFMQSVVSFFSYAAKLKKSYRECKPFIEDYYNSYLLKNAKGEMPAPMTISSLHISYGEKRGFHLMYRLFAQRHFYMMYIIFAYKLHKMPVLLRKVNREG